MTPSSSRRSASRFTSCRRRCPRGGGRYRPRASPVRLRRAHLLGHRDVRPAASDLYRPSGSRDALRWRHTALDLAREQAKVLGLGSLLPGAPSRPASGTGRPARPTSTPTSPTRSSATGPRPATTLSSMRLAWNYSSRPPGSGSIGHHDGYCGFRIDGVTGPDEYSAIADNNVYTNLMAQKNLLEAANAAERHPERAGSPGSSPRRWLLGETRPRPCSSYTTRPSACTPRPRSSPTMRSGPSRTRGPISTCCCCTSTTSTSTASRSSSRLTWCWRCT